MKSIDYPSSDIAKLYTPNFILMWCANFFTATCLGSFFLFPLFIKDLGGSKADIGILMGAVTISAILGRPWIAQAVDQFGRKKSYFIGTSSFVIIPFILLFIKGNISIAYPYIFAIRVLHGFGIALCFTSAFTLIADMIPQNRLSEGLGMFGVTGLIGAAIGPAISEPIIRNFGFNVYFISIAGCAIVSLILQLPLPETYKRERSMDEGVSFMGVLRRKKISGLAVLTVFFGVALATQNSFVAPFGEDIGLPNISIYFIAYSFGAVLARVFGAKMGDRIGEVRIIPWAQLLIAVGFLSLVFVDNNVLLTFSGFITGIGHGFLFPCLNALMLRNEPINIRGKLNGIFTGSVDVGIFAGSMGLGYIGEWFGYKILFITTFLVLIFGLALFLGYFRRIVR